MNFQGTGVYRHTSTHKLIFAYRHNSITHILTIPLKNHHKVSNYLFEHQSYTLYLPAEGRSLDQMLTDYPELLI